MIRPLLVALATLSVLHAGARTTSAQENDSAEPPAFTESFFSFFGDELAGSADALRICASSLGRPLTNSGRFIERNTREVAELVTECVGDSTSAEYARECELAVARSEVDLVFFYMLTALGDDRWLFEVAAHRPMVNARVWSADTVADGEDPRLVAREVCGQLGARFLQHTGGGGTSDTRRGAAEVGSTPSATTPAGEGAVLEVLDVDPTPATVTLNGQEIGVAPNQFFPLEPGTATIEISAPGHRPWVDAIELVDGEVQAVRGVRLEPFPATIAVSSNVHGATILVDDAAVATTSATAPVTVTTAPTARELRVQRDGYVDWVRDVALTPGGRVSFHAELSLEPGGPGSTIELHTSRADARYEVAIQTAAGTYRCPEEVRATASCTLAGIPPGPARVIVSGSAEFEQQLVVPRSDARVELIQRNVRRRWMSALGLVSGGALLGWGIAEDNRVLAYWGGLVASYGLVYGLLSWFDGPRYDTEVRAVDGKVTWERDIERRLWGGRVEFGFAPARGGGLVGGNLRF